LDRFLKKELVKKQLLQVITSATPSKAIVAGDNTSNGVEQKNNIPSAFTSVLHLQISLANKPANK
jgi:hypothetical protein